jgi:DNA-directed RNA polymerase subunit RPC12/RpoP
MSDSKGALTCEECSTPEGCSEHRLFTCVSCGKQVSWSDADDDERPNDCSTCWAKWRAALVSGPDAMTQVPRSWPPNTGCDPTTIVGGFGGQGSSRASAGLQVVAVAAVAAEHARAGMNSRERDLVISAVGHLDSSRYARQAGDNGSAESALNACRRVLLGLAGISDGGDTAAESFNVGNLHAVDA